MKNKNRNALVFRYFFISVLVGVIFVSLRVLVTYGEGGERQLKPDRQPHVLIINAYHRGYGWTDSQTDAILEAFEASPMNPVYHVEYLDWKRQANEENLHYYHQLLSHKYKDQDIDLILTTDDIAMQFAIDYRPSLAPGAPIVFTGVFEETAKVRMDGVDGITGVYESIDPYGTMEMIIELHPNLKHIYILNDATETGKDVEEEILTAVTHHACRDGITYELLNHHSYKAIYEILENPKEDSVVFMGVFNSDSLGNVMNNEVFCERLAKAIDIPIYGTYEYLFDHGIVGGSLLAGSLQGAKGAEFALKVLSGTEVSTIGVHTVKTVYQGIDHHYAKKHAIDTKRLTGPYELINRPITAFEAYRVAAFTGMAVIALLMFFILLLTLNIRVRRKTQHELEMKHDELAELYEALAGSEEELKAQNQEMTNQQQEIRYLAYNDKLTKLPNRNGIEKALKSRIAKETEQRKMILIVDVDNFNHINTAYGHAFGDGLLKHIGESLLKLQCDDCFVGRLAGDEFILIWSLENRSEESVLGEVDAVFDRPMGIMGKEIKVTKSIGYTIYPDDGDSYEELIRRTDMAKKIMKQKGKGMSSRFMAAMNEEMNDRIAVTQGLKLALQEEELFLTYQPQYDVDTKKIIGFESLLRWNSKTIGPVSPAVFIPLAEEIGEIIPIGNYVIEEGFKFLGKHREHLAPDFKLSINISVLQLLRQDFTAKVKGLIHHYGVNPRNVEFEITESVMIESFDVVNQRLLGLKLLGIAIALDDFGTGYSSLTYLKKLPISTLKIDKAFIDGIIAEGDRHFFTKSIIDIAQKLGFRVVAEGVEEAEQVHYLKACGSPIIQGYWFSKPLEETAAIELYIENRAQNRIGPDAL